MIILEAIMAKTHSKKSAILDVGENRIIVVSTPSWEFHLVWIENDQESDASDIKISYN